MPEQTINCTSACTVTLVHELSLPVLNLTLEEGGLIGGAILLVWAGGWAIRMCVRVINSADATPVDQDGF